MAMVMLSGSLVVDPIAMLLMGVVAAESWVLLTPPPPSHIVPVREILDFGSGWREDAVIDTARSLIPTDKSVKCLQARSKIKSEQRPLSRARLDHCTTSLSLCLSLL
jgi:hypothetical protein